MLCPAALARRAPPALSPTPRVAARTSGARPVLVPRGGLEVLSSPLLGVTIGMTASAAAYGLPLMVRRKQQGALPASTDALLFKIAAGVLVGLSTWARWVALDLAPVAPVLALTLVSVPVVILLSPIVSGKHQEPGTVGLGGGGG